MYFRKAPTSVAPTALPRRSLNSSLLISSVKAAFSGSVVSTAEAFSKCGITTNPDELKKLEDTAENAAFTELISKEELRDLLGKAVGATLVGALRKYIREKEGVVPDDSDEEDDPYSYVSQDPAQRDT